ncbi:uncharacterized protein LOC112534351 [Ricinus communis]|uniref:uncharacterized protein LOC112534351 n=1 Tax=Ricinus communis TaxID=3988 RepID=UPI00201ABE92|nr:uncharacterized protein LOC112534351 [Ricinus communis]
MEQNLLSHHPNGRNNKSKGLDKKSCLQVVLLIAVCLWLLHQIKNSHHHNGNPKNPSERNVNNIGYLLGRKGILMEYEKRDGGVGDDELDANLIDDLENGLKLEQQELFHDQVLNGGDYNNKAANSLKKQVISHTENVNQESEIEMVSDHTNIGENVEAFLDENGIPPDASYVSLDDQVDQSKNIYIN